MSEANAIVVTGATGRVGHQLAQLLLSAGETIRAVARTGEKLKPLGVRGADVRPGSLGDRAFLTSVFRGAAAAYVLSPADSSSPDVNAEQEENVESIAGAVRESSVTHVVLNSSWGADLPDKTGGIAPLHLFEKLLDKVPGLNVVHLRSAYFMENHLWSIGLIKGAGVNGSTFKLDVLFPMVATRDIAAVAADYLANRNFECRTVRYLQGRKNHTMVDVTRILGASIGKPDLEYVEFTEAEYRRGLLGAGLSPNAADLYIEMIRGINAGRIRGEPRSTTNTSRTTLEEFARTVFAPAFKA